MASVSALDEKILAELDHAPASASALARSLAVPRTTILYRLQRLQTLKRIEAGKGRGMEKLWKRHYQTSIGKSSFMVFEGNTFWKVYSEQWKLKKGSTIYEIACAETIEDTLKKLPRSFILESQRRIRQRQIIVRSILHESATKLLEQFDSELLRAHRGRTLGIKQYLSRKLFRGAGQIIVAHSFIILINTKVRRSVLIRDRQLVAMLFDILSLLFDLIEAADEVTVKKFNMEQTIDMVIGKWKD